MKHLFLFSAFICMSVAGLFAGNGSPAPKSIDLANSKIVWKGYKVTGSHEGTLSFKSGSLDFTGDKLTGGELVVNMGSLNCTDLKEGMKGKLEGHLKSADFFGVEKFPEASIKFTKVIPRGIPGEYKVTANLTIKGITKEIKFNASAKDGMGSASIKVDRSEFDIRYGSGSFFDNLGDKTIYDEFDLDINIKF